MHGLHLVETALQERHRRRRDVFFLQVRTGPSEGLSNSGIIDALAIARSWTKPCVTAYEIKISHSDFVNDHKWDKYLDHCNELYFACPKDVIRRDEIQPPAGLVYVTTRGARIARKAIYRPTALSVDLLLYLMMNRATDDSGSKRQKRAMMLQAWLERNGKFRKIGRQIGGRLGATVLALDKRKRDLAERESRLRRREDAVSRIETAFEAAGCPLQESGPSVQDLLNRAVATESLREAERAVSEIRCAVRRLDRAGEALAALNAETSNQAG